MTSAGGELGIKPKIPPNEEKKRGLKLDDSEEFQATQAKLPRAGSEELVEAYNHIPCGTILLGGIFRRLVPTSYGRSGETIEKSVVLAADRLGLEIIGHGWESTANRMWKKMMWAKESGKFSINRQNVSEFYRSLEDLKRIKSVTKQKNDPSEFVRKLLAFNDVCDYSISIAIAGWLGMREKIRTQMRTELKHYAVRPTLHDVLNEIAIICYKEEKEFLSEVFNTTNNLWTRFWAEALSEAKYPETKRKELMEEFSRYVEQEGIATLLVAAVSKDDDDDVQLFQLNVNYAMRETIEAEMGSLKRGPSRTYFIKTEKSPAAVGINEDLGKVQMRRLFSEIEKQKPWDDDQALRNIVTVIEGADFLQNSGGYRLINDHVLAHIVGKRGILELESPLPPPGYALLLYRIQTLLKMALGHLTFPSLWSRKQKGARATAANPQHKDYLHPEFKIPKRYFRQLRFKFKF